MGARKRSFGKSSKNRRKIAGRVSAQVVNSTSGLARIVYTVSGLLLMFAASLGILNAHLLDGHRLFLFVPGLIMLIGVFLIAKPHLDAIDGRSAISPVDVSILKIKALLERNSK